MLFPILVAVLAVATLVFIVTRTSTLSANTGQKVTDEDFLAAVPYAHPERALRIRAIISDQLDVPLHDLHPNDRFLEDLKAD